MASQQGNISILGQGIKTRSVGNNTCEMEVDSTFVIKPKKKKHRHRRKKSKNADSIQTSEMIETGLITPAQEIITEEETSELIKEVECGHMLLRNGQMTQPHGKHAGDEMKSSQRNVKPTEEGKKTKQGRVVIPEQEIGNGRKTQPPGNQAGDQKKNSLTSRHSQTKNGQRSKKQNAITPTHEIITEHETNDVVKETKFMHTHSRNGQRTQPPGNQAGDHTENSLTSNHKQNKNWQKFKKQKAVTPTHEISTEHDTSDLVTEMKFRQIHSRNERTTQPLGNQKSKKEKAVTPTHETITEHKADDSVKETKFRLIHSPSGRKTQPPGNQTGDHTENSLNTNNKQTKNGQKSQEEKAVTPTYEISRPARHNTTVLVKDMKFRQIDSRNERTTQPLGNQKSQKEKAVTPTHEIITEHEANDVIKDMKFKKMRSPSGRKTQPPGKRAVFEMSSSLTSNKKQNENQRRRLKEKNAIYQRLETWSCNKIPDYLVWSISKGLRLLISLTSQASIPQDWYRLLVLILARASQAENQKEETRDVFEVLGQSEFLGKHLFDYLDNTQIKNQSMKDGLEFFFNIIDIIQLVLETDPSFSRNCPDIVYSLADVVKIILPLNVQDAVNTRLAVVIKKCIDVSKNLQEPKTALARPRQRTSDRSKTIISNWSIGLMTGFQFNCRPSVRCGTPETDDTDLDDLMADKLEEEDIHLLSVAQKVDSSWKQNKHKKEHWGDRNYPGERQFHTRKGNREQRDFTYW